MTIPLGLNGATIPNANLETGIRAAGEAGFSFYKPRIPLLLDCEEKGSRGRAVSALRRSGLTWLPLNALEGLFALEPAALLTRADSVFSLAKRFGVSQVIVVPGQPTHGTTSIREAQETLRTVKDRASSHEISLLYELIGFSSHAFPSLEQAHAVASSAGIQLVLDTFHLAVSKTRLQEIAGLSSDAIGLVHLSDALTRGTTLEELRDGDRVLPGEGELPLVDLLTAISRTGYHGPASVEVFHPRYGERDSTEVAREAYQLAQDVLKAAGWPGETAKEQQEQGG